MNIRIGTYNIANGRYVDWDFVHIARDIVSKDLDIVGLQEVDKFAARSKFTHTIEILKELTGMQYYAYFSCINIEGDEAKYGQKGEYGTAILSRYPITETAEIELNDGSFAERRLLTHAMIDFNGKYVNFYNTHLSVSYGHLRQDEFVIVAETLKNKQNCILTGDFNVNGYEEFDALKPLSFVNNPQSDIVTYPEGELRIDNICYTTDFTLVTDSVGTLDDKHSDHAMLFAEFEF